MTPLHRDFASALYRTLELLGAKSDLLAVIGSWGDTYTDEQVTAELKAWNTYTMEQMEKRVAGLRDVQRQRAVNVARAAFYAAVDRQFEANAAKKLVEKFEAGGKLALPAPTPADADRWQWPREEAGGEPDLPPGDDTARQLFYKKNAIRGPRLTDDGEADAPHVVGGPS